MRRSPPGSDWTADPAAHRCEFTGAAGQRDGGRKLRRQRHDEGHRIVGEAARIALAQRQHAEHLAVLDDRHAEKGAKQRFAAVIDVEVARMIVGVIEIDDVGALGHPADQAAVQRQAHPPDRIRPQPVGRMQAHVRDSRHR
jgi:hypothetical protein